jgi:hypothetical protein
MQELLDRVNAWLAELSPALSQKLRWLQAGGSSLAFRNVWRAARALYSVLTR